MSGPDTAGSDDLQLARDGATRVQAVLAKHVSSLEKDWAKLSPGERAEGLERAKAARDAIEEVLTRLAETPTS